MPHERTDETALRQLIGKELGRHGVGYLDEDRVRYAIKPFLQEIGIRLDSHAFAGALQLLVDVCVRYTHYYKGAPDPEVDDFEDPEEADDPFDLRSQPPIGQPPPLPLLKPTPLTAAEIKWLLGWAKERATVIGVEDEFRLACCIASLLPFFKSGHIHKQSSVCITRDQLWDAADSGWPGRQWERQPHDIIEVLGMFQIATRGRVYEGVPRAASYALTIEVPLSDEVVSSPLEPGSKVEPGLRYKALQGATRGQDWRQPDIGLFETAEQRHLMPEELGQLVERFDGASEEVAFDSIALGVFCAQLMERVKHAFSVGRPYARLTYRQINDCLLMFQPIEKAIQASGVFEFVPGWTSPYRTPHFAVRVKAGAFTFSDDAPKRRLWRKEKEREVERCWAAIKQAVALAGGDDPPP